MENTVRLNCMCYNTGCPEHYGAGCDTNTLHLVRVFRGVPGDDGLLVCPECARHYTAAEVR